MQVKEITCDGLARALQVTVPSSVLSDRLGQRLNELAPQAKLPGFRPGKVPVAHLRRLYGPQLMSEIIQDVVNESSQEMLKARDERPALQPEIKLIGEIDPVMAADADLVFDMSFEVIPPIKLVDFASFELERPVAEVDDSRVDEQLGQLARTRQSFTPRAADAKAQKGDRLRVDFVGRIDGVEFEGGRMEGSHLVLGSEQFIPGFEDQLVGAQSGSTHEISVVFPEDYGKADLASKPAQFTVSVHEVASPENVMIDDALAVSFGLKDLDELKARIREQSTQDLARFSRAHLKKAILDAIVDTHDFELPPAMVTNEFEQIWGQFTQELEERGESPDSAEEDTLRAEYQKIAERRVCTGLVIAETSNSNNITVSDEEIQRGIFEQTRQYPGQEQKIIEYFKNNPQAQAQIRAPLIEEKVIDFIIEMAHVTDKKVSLDKLTTDLTPAPKTQKMTQKTQTK